MHLQIRLPSRLLVTDDFVVLNLNFQHIFLNVYEFVFRAAFLEIGARSLK